MDGLGINPVGIQTLPSAKGRQAPILPKPSSDSAPIIETKGTEFDAGLAEHKRYEAVRKAAGGVANVYVVSDRRFTIFKDSTGQYITRFTSLRDGKVTYIPEPDLIKMSGSSGATQTLSIDV